MNQLKQDRFLFWPILFLSFCLAVSLVIFLLLYPILPSKLPLFYSLPWGESQLVQKGQFFILSLTLLLVGLINLIFVWQLHAAQFILKRLLSLSLIAISLIIFITTFKIIIIFV